MALLVFVLVVVVSFFSGVVVVVVVVVFCSGVPVVVVSFFSGVAGVVVVVVVFFSVVAAGAWANTVVTNATLINTASTTINAFFILFLLLEFFILHLIEGIQSNICATATSRWEKERVPFATILDCPCIIKAIRYRLARVATPFQPLRDYDDVIFL